MSASEFSPPFDDDEPDETDHVRKQPGLRYVEYEPAKGPPVWPTTGWALQAAVIAALAAVLIGSGIAILLAVF